MIHSIIAHITAIEIYFVAVINPIGAAVNLMVVINVGAVGVVNRYINGNIEPGEADEDVEMGEADEDVEMRDVNEAIEMGEDDDDIEMVYVDEDVDMGADADHL
jgi:hypothetical protein